MRAISAEGRAEGTRRRTPRGDGREELHGVQEGGDAVSRKPSARRVSVDIVVRIREVKAPCGHVGGEDEGWACEVGVQVLGVEASKGQFGSDGWVPVFSKGVDVGGLI
jgi:hypothetical protein